MMNLARVLQFIWIQLLNLYGNVMHVYNIDILIARSMLT
jgi:hypothetical protein